MKRLTPLRGLDNVSDDEINACIVYKENRAKSELGI